jgi:hypothetical protein
MLTAPGAAAIRAEYGIGLRVGPDFAANAMR